MHMALQKPHGHNSCIPDVRIRNLSTDTLLVASRVHVVLAPHRSPAFEDVQVGAQLLHGLTHLAADQQAVHLQPHVAVHALDGVDDGVIGVGDLAVSHHQDVGLRPLLLREPLQAELEGGVHIRAAHEGAAQELQQLVQVVQVDAQVQLLNLIWSGESVQVARPLLAVCAPQALQGQCLGHSLTSTLHGAAGVQAQDDGA
mmetsp:Transcript_7287/g.15917  ORF Transcript_7287/g.15917 Transcript_7287/m.15917 type:complete len:200 (-) Transcript_7287:895-1494(-)